MVMRQKMIAFASSIGFTTLWNIVERYSSKNAFKIVQISKSRLSTKKDYAFPSILQIITL